MEKEEKLTRLFGESRMIVDPFTVLRRRRITRRPEHVFVRIHLKVGAKTDKEDGKREERDNANGTFRVFRRHSRHGVKQIVERLSNGINGLGPFEREA